MKQSGYFFYNSMSRSVLFLLYNNEFLSCEWHALIAIEYLWNKLELVII